MIIGVDHVQVAAPAGGEDAARAFYGDLLGLPEVEKPERLRSRGGVWFAVGDEQLHVGIEDPFSPARKAHAFSVGAGVGGALVEAVADAARAAGCARLRVTTTNDNLPALRLYQRHGFALAVLHRGAVNAARERKPAISLTGHAGIPMRDEIELERAL